MGDLSKIYSMLDFPMQNAPKDRPYTFINMVSTIDGKTVSGERGEPVGDLGSEADKKVMRRIENAADAVLIGASSQRSSSDIHFPSHLLRIVATRSGRLLWESRFFKDDPTKAVVLCPELTELTELPNAPNGLRTLRAGTDSIDWPLALRNIRSELGVRRLLVEGGSDINGQLLGLDLVDELFLTIAPKVKLGAETPTYASGDALPRGQMQDYHLIEEHHVGDEVFLRYRRLRDRR